MLRFIRFRHQHANVVTDHFIGRIAKYFFEARIDRNNGAVFSSFDDTTEIVQAINNANKHALVVDDHFVDVQAKWKDEVGGGDAFHQTTLPQDVAFSSGEIIGDVGVVLFTIRGRDQNFDVLPKHFFDTSFKNVAAGTINTLNDTMFIHCYDSTVAP